MNSLKGVQQSPSLSSQGFASVPASPTLVVLSNFRGPRSQPSPMRSECLGLVLSVNSFKTSLGGTVDGS